jgi:peptidoglycan-associated lipoprotein
MRSKFIQSLALSAAALGLVLSVSCAKKPVKDPGAEGNGASGAPVAETPTTSAVDANKPMDTDPQGSDSGKISGLSTVFFDYDKAALTKDARKKLSDNAEWIKGHPNFTIQVEGHTDARGSVEYNLALGERRAKSVKAYLETLGIEGKRITIISYGKEKPIDTGDNDSAYAKNRRANFVPIQ